MVDVENIETFETSSYGTVPVAFPDLSPSKAKIFFEVNSSFIRSAPVNVATDRDAAIRGMNTQRFHKGLTTPKSQSETLNIVSSGIRAAGLDILLKGVESGTLGATTNNGGTTLTYAPFGNVSLKAGDTSMGVVLVYNRTPTVYSVPSGYTLKSSATLTYGSNTVWYALIQRDNPVTQAGSYPGAALNFAVYPNAIGNQLCYTFGLTPAGPEGVSFQIMHNGQLIPATPNLWSGGQLTPVGLNLPE